MSLNEGLFDSFRKKPDWRLSNLSSNMARGSRANEEPRTGQSMLARQFSKVLLLFLSLLVLLLSIICTIVFLVELPVSEGNPKNRAVVLSFGVGTVYFSFISVAIYRSWRWILKLHAVVGVILILAQLAMLVFVLTHADMAPSNIAAQLGPACGAILMVTDDSREATKERVVKDIPCFCYCQPYCLDADLDSAGSGGGVLDTEEFGGAGPECVKMVDGTVDRHSEDCLPNCMESVGRSDRAMEAAALGTCAVIQLVMVCASWTLGKSSGSSRTSSPGDIPLQGFGAEDKLFADVEKSNARQLPKSRNRQATMSRDEPATRPQFDDSLDRLRNMGDGAW